MPSFFDGFWRMVKGEPLFTSLDKTPPSDDTDVTKPQHVPTPTVPQPITPAQDKPLPYVAITRWEHEYYGTNVQVNLSFQNKSSEMIEIDRILIFNQTVQLCEMLSPGEVREKKIYYGAPLTRSASTKVEVWYKDREQCSFGSMHAIEYKINREGNYEIAQMRFLAPVRKYR